MKTLIMLTLLLASNMAFSAAINCSTSSGTTACTSADVPPANIVPAAQATNAPVSNLVVNNPVGATVDVYHAENTVPLKTNLFISNSGTPFNLNVNAKSKWNTMIPTNGLLQAPPASPILVVADRIANVNVDVSGYVGKNGSSSSSMCVSKILSNQYGVAQADLFKTRCTDGTTASPCAANKIRATCDAQDIANINNSIGAPPGLCPIGFNYSKLNDDNLTPSQTLTKINPKVLKRCERPAFTSQVRTCKSREISCHYSFYATSGTYSARVNSITANSGTYIDRIETLYSNPGGAVYANAFFNFGTRAYPSVPALMLKFNIVLKDLSFNDASNDLSCPTVNITNQWTYSGGGSETTSYAFSNPTPPGVALKSNATLQNKTNFTDFPGAHIVDPVGWNGANDIFGQDTNLLPTNTNAPLIMDGLAVTLTNNIVRQVPDTSSCAINESDQGVTPVGTANPVSVGFIDAAEMCPSAVGSTPAYGDTGLLSNHNLTTTYTSINNTSVNPLQVDSIPCTISNCSGGAYAYTSNNINAESLTLGSGEQGSYGSMAVIFAYDTVGVETYTFSNGLNGSNGVNDITVPTVIKNCLSIANDSSPNPQGIFRQLFWKLFTFNPSSTSYNNAFPTRNLGDAIIMMKKVSPGIRDLVKEQTCPSCP